MRFVTLTAIAAAVLAASTAAAQVSPGAPLQPGVYTNPYNYDSGSGVAEINGRTSGILATSPSRMRRSREMMNMGREQVWRSHMTPTQIRRAAQQTIERGGIQCTVAEAAMVAQMRDGTPVVEVACDDGVGFIMAATSPVQATDCLDFRPGEGVFGPCKLESNVARVAARAQ